MLENSVEVSPKLSLVQNPSGVVPTLKEMVAQDKELLEFFRIIHQNDLREKALELLESRRARRKD